MHLPSDADQGALFPDHSAGQNQLQVASFQPRWPFYVRLDNGSPPYIRVGLKKRSATAHVDGYALGLEVRALDLCLKTEGESN